MIKIERFAIEHSTKSIVVDTYNPIFSFCLFSDLNNVEIKKCRLKINDWSIEFKDERSIEYNGPKLKPFTSYNAVLYVETNSGECDFKELKFETGFLNTKWKGRWISDPLYTFKDKKVSPVPLAFKKTICFKDNKIKEIKLYATSIGVYDVLVNNKKISNRFFAPGFTNYKSNLQYQTYDLTNELHNGDALIFVVAGGWAVGSFVMNRQNRFIHDKQCLLCELHIKYDNNEEIIIPSDDSWEVSSKTPFISADLYDGEVYDANISILNNGYHKSSYETIKYNPQIIADRGCNVIKHEKFIANYLYDINNKHIYDFKQNFAGIVHFKVKNVKKNQRIIVKHAEVLTNDGDLNTKLLRSAKAEIVYICEGKEIEEFEPTFTYMGFRYISIEGIELENIEVVAYALYSDLDQIGKFECSNNLINRLQQNIVWSSKSNFIDIPTDCPQRDERMGWTGDINVFTPTAYFNFDMTRFLNKWLIDVKSEQGKGGGIPNTIPSNGYGFPLTMPLMAIDFWGDAIVNIPYFIYKITDEKRILEKYYENMKKYVKAELFWSKLFSFGKNKYIFNTINMLHFGDWIAPDCDQMSKWQARHKWTATCSMKLCSDVCSKAALVLDNQKDYVKYSLISKNISSAFKHKLTDGNSKLLKEFQTGYVLPIYFDIFNEDEKKKAASNLAKLVKDNDYCIGTGFPGTPYILFALFDNGQKDVAEKMLLNTKCPSWLYEVKVGATTIRERWDGLTEDGKVNLGDDGTGGMISFNHYASGAVGDFFYRRIAGIEMIENGYKCFKIKPNILSSITWINASTYSKYGKIVSNWKIENNDKFLITIKVPIGSKCELELPSGKKYLLENGEYNFEERI